MKKIINRAMKIIFILYCLFVIYVVYDILHYQDYKYWLIKVEEKISNRYVIWTNWKDRKICDNFLKYWCLEWNIISYKNDWLYAYIYYKPYAIYGSFSEWRIYYPVFWPYDNNVIKEEGQKPDLIKLHLSTWYREFFYSKDIDTLDNKIDVNIFKNLLNLNI